MEVNLAQVSFQLSSFFWFLLPFIYIFTHFSSPPPKGEARKGFTEVFKQKKLKSQTTAKFDQEEKVCFLMKFQYFVHYEIKSLQKYTVFIIILMNFWWIIEIIKTPHNYMKGRYILGYIHIYSSVYYIYIYIHIMKLCRLFTSI